MRWGTAAVVAAAAAGTGVAVLALGRKVSERAVHPRADRASGARVVRVLGLAAGRVTLTRTVETARPGHYAIEWGVDGHGVVGEILQSDQQGVTRRLERADTGTLETGTVVRLTPRVLLGNPTTALGLPFLDTAAVGESGPLPAWYLDGMRGTWVLLVHGPGADRQQTLPVIALLNRLRLPVLAVTYRGDDGAPASPDGLGHFGDTEWRDVEAAVRLALDSGAGKVVLYGWSLGATMALQTAARSAWADAVCGLILDSPVLDWSRTVRREAAGAGVSAPLAGLGAPGGPGALRGRPGGLRPARRGHRPAGAGPAAAEPGRHRRPVVGRRPPGRAPREPGHPAAGARRRARRAVERRPGRVRGEPPALPHAAALTPAAGARVPVPVLPRRRRPGARPCRETPRRDLPRPGPPASPRPPAPCTRALGRAGFGRRTHPVRPGVTGLRVRGPPAAVGRGGARRGGTPPI
ncbi:hypothetical protein [Kitasatospora sp. NBC_00240]|uniref:alpha/beta hydrolase family protein n=1 Tax=Kitasatospora sp. NBC_00240 TaxID=2903567 RepID=UPI002B1DF932|nr:hypothetical protein [Kitasatospora sp. NBC_00240]